MNLKKVKSVIMCIVLSFIRLNLHFNLREDYQVEYFLNDCDTLK